jgi:hypothetical protein
LAFVQLTFQSTSEVLVSLSNKTMESAKKKHMIAFHKKLLIYDPSFGLKLLQQIHVHYNMNPNLERMTEKLQLFVSFQVSNEQKILWLK